MFLEEERLQPDVIRKVRWRLAQKPLLPMTLFCGLKGMEEILKGTGISLEEVKKHSNQIVPGLWRFYIADYDNPTRTPARRNQRLVNIAANTQALRECGSGERSHHRSDAAGTPTGTDDKG